MNYNANSSKGSRKLRPLTFNDCHPYRKASKSGTGRVTAKNINVLRTIGSVIRKT